MTLPECVDPAMGERLLAEPRDPGVAEHLAACAACQARAERTSRMTAVWRADEPEESEVAAARARVRALGAGRRRSRVLPLVVAFAVMLGGAGALAAARVASMRAQGAGRAAEGSSMNTEGAPAMPAVHPLGASSPPNAPSAPAISPADNASAELVAPTPPPPAPLQPSRAASSPVASSPARTAAPEASSATATWSTAAQAMRSGDYAGAERAFDDLSRSADGRTRDEARLARAQVLAADGRSEEARTELESLARAGATTLVRTRAADALRSLPERPLTPSGVGN